MTNDYYLLIYQHFVDSISFIPFAVCTRIYINKFNLNKIPGFIRVII